MKRQKMAFLMAITMLGVIAIRVLHFISKPEKRAAMLHSFAEDPIRMSFLLVWMIFFVMFYEGIIVAPFWMINSTDDGRQVWEIGGWGSGMWLIGTIFIKGS
jgi:hypothetical protein